MSVPDLETLLVNRQGVSQPTNCHAIATAPCQAGRIAAIREPDVRARYAPRRAAAHRSAAIEPLPAAWAEVEALANLARELAVAAGLADPPDGHAAADGAWLPARAGAPLDRPVFDADCDPDEQLPRLFAMSFREKQIAGRPYVGISIGAVTLGDRLSDRIHGHPLSRYHDVFHLAHVAVLGWSPVMRNLLGCKRVSDPYRLELEDCHRAQVVEEAIVSLVFGHVSRCRFAPSQADLTPELFRAIEDLTRGYEVERCQADAWAEAIGLGCAAYRSLTSRLGGTVVVDMTRRALRVL